MNILIYGPKACGKTRNKAALAQKFGKAKIIDGLCRIGRGLYRSDDGQVHRTFDECLILTNADSSEAHQIARDIRAYTVMPFDAAMQAPGQ